MTRIEPLRIQIFNGSFTTLLILIVLLNSRLKEREDTIEKLQEELNDKKEEFVKLEKVLQQQKDKNNVSISACFFCILISKVMNNLRYFVSTITGSLSSIMASQNTHRLE